jgi:hypothetical protein
MPYLEDEIRNAKGIPDKMNPDQTYVISMGYKPFSDTLPAELTRHSTMITSPRTIVLVFLIISVLVQR